MDHSQRSRARLPRRMASLAANTVEEYVENGQLLLLRIGDWDEVYGG